MVLRADGATLTWVTWVDGPRRQGRPVKLDAQSKPVWVIPGLVKMMSFEGCTIIHPAIGTVLRRVGGPRLTASGASGVLTDGRGKRAKPNMRPDIAQSVLRLYRSWEAALAKRSGTALQAAVCTICNFTDVPCTDSVEFAELCPCCMMSWHKSCAKRLLDIRRIAAFGAAEIVGLPSIIREGACTWCSAFLSARSSASTASSSGAAVAVGI